MADVSLLFNLMARDSTGAGLNSASSGFKSTFGKISKVVALGMGGAAVAMLGFAKDAAESAKVTRMVEQVVKSTGGVAGVSAEAVDKLATSISNKTGADDEAIASGAALLLTFTNVKNGVGEGNDIFNQATQTAVDMAAAMNGGEVSADGLKGANIQLGKALNDPIKGISALSKVGVSFTEQQKEQIKVMVKAGDTAGAQKLILAELGKEFGGQAAAATDPMVKLQTVLGNLAETLGAIVLPYVEKFSTKMAEVANWIGNNEGKVRALGAVLGVMGAAILAVNVGMKVHTAVLALTSGAWRLLATVMWANPVFLIAGILIGVGVALVVLYKKSETFRNIVNGAFRSVRDVVVGVWDTIKYAVNLAIKVVTNAFVLYVDTVLSGVEGMLRAYAHLPDFMGGGKANGAANAVAGIRASLQSLKDKVNELPTSKKMEVEMESARALEKIRALKAQVNGTGWTISIGTSGPDGIGVRLPARAAGGPVSAGGTYLVGERGPEVVTMGGRGFVTPNHALRGGGGGGTTVISFASTGDRLLDAILAELRKHVKVNGGIVQDVLGRS